MLGSGGISVVDFRILGPLEVSGGAGLVPVGPPRVRTVFALLLIRRGVPVGVDQVVDELWPRDPPGEARALVHGYISRLRRALRGAAAGRLLTRKPGYLLAVDDAEVDAGRFERLAGQARAARKAGRFERSIELFDLAHREWRGDPFADVPRTATVEASAARLSELRLATVEERVDTALETGLDGGLIGELTGLVDAYPLRERLVGQLMLALHRAGRTADALDAYARLRRLLSGDLGIDPGRPLRRLHEQILRADPALEAPPGRRQYVNAAPVSQLPADAPDFTGRETAVDDVVRMLDDRTDDGPPPMVVIAGGPGVGKSTLAVHAARAVAGGFPDGQLYLDLAGTSGEPREPAVMLAEMLNALGVTGAGIPEGQDARVALYRSLLAGRRMLLLLDDAANAGQARPLVPPTGRCAVVITGRRLLTGLPGARHVELDVFQPREALDLFARIVGPSRVAAEPDSAEAIVRSSGYLPLAVRIAGGRLAGRPAWSLRVLRERLDDESHRLTELRIGELGVRSSFDLSLRLLPADAVRGFRLLGLLGNQAVPGWVLAPLLDRQDADEVLDLLVDTNLVRLTGTDANGQPRYRLHDLLRAYALEGAATIPPRERERAVRRLLGTWLDLATRAADRLPVSLFRQPPGGSPRWSLPPAVARRLVAAELGWFDAERHSLLAAVRLAADWGEDELAWELATTAAGYYDHRSLYEDWQRACQIALRAARAAGNQRGAALLLHGLGQVGIYRDHYDEATANLCEALRLFQQAGDKPGEALATAGLATISRIRDDRDRALEQARLALDLATAAENRHLEAQLRNGIAGLLLGLGRVEEARGWFDDALALARRLGDLHREAVVLRGLSALYDRVGEPDRALAGLRRAHAIFEALDDGRCMASTLLGEGRVHAARGDRPRAHSALTRAAVIFRRNGDRTDEAKCWQVLGELDTARADHANARLHLERAQWLLARVGQPG